MIKKFVEYNRQNRSGEYKIEASMAKLVRRHTSNVEIIGSNPIGSIIFFHHSYSKGKIVYI